MKKLLHRIDTLSIGYKCNHIDSDLLSQFKEIKELMPQGSPVTIKGFDFELKGFGYKNYAYVLVNDDCTIYVAKEAKCGAMLPEVYITWRSSFLWSQGWENSVAIVETWLRKWVDWIEAVPSRVDLCCDIECNLPEIKLGLGEAVSRARKRKAFRNDEYYTGKEISGYSFGNSDLVCRIYDKLHETGLSKKEWFKTLWGKEGWLVNRPVTRVEFQCRRNFLNDMGINSVYELKAILPDLWKYATEKWLTIRDYNADDKNSHRWKLNDIWTFVQHCWTGTCAGIERWRQRRNSIELARKRALSYCASLVALSSMDYLIKEIALEYPLERFNEKLALYKARFAYFKDPVELIS